MVIMLPQFTHCKVISKVLFSFHFTSQVWKELEELNSWLDGTESEIPAISAIETTSELNTSLSLITKIKDNLDSKVDELEDLNRLGNRFLQNCSSNITF